QTGSVFRLRGKGIPNLRSGARGDQFVTIRVETPIGLTPEQKELLRRFDGEGKSGAQSSGNNGGGPFGGREGKKRKRGK
ncbi:MAG: molecular chaperone DnaJ, partial [Oscillospiraceae bacterium]|nr:molecular chaperone DnaJ [Oscillospiraceae bacterium]